MLSNEEIIELLLKQSHFGQPEYRFHFTNLFKEKCNLNYRTIEDIILGKKKFNSVVLHKILEGYQKNIRKQIMYSIKGYQQEPNLETFCYACSILGYYLSKLYVEKETELKQEYGEEVSTKVMDANFFTAEVDYNFLKYTDNKELKELLKDKIKFHLNISLEVWEKEKGFHEKIPFRQYRASLMYLTLYKVSKDISNLLKSQKYIKKAKSIMLNLLEHFDKIYKKTFKEIKGIHHNDVYINNLIIEYRDKECKINEKYKNYFLNPKPYIQPKTIV